MADMTSLVWMQYKGICFYCADKVDPLVATVDHFVPRSKGGSSGRLNAVLACEPCNGAKADLDPRTYGLLFPTAITAQQREGLAQLCKVVVARSQKFRRLPRVDQGDNEVLASAVSATADNAISALMATGELPMFDAYLTNAEGQDDGVLHPIGAAWVRRGGVGLDLQLAAMPVNGRLLLLPHGDQREPNR